MKTDIMNTKIISKSNTKLGVRETEIFNCIIQGMKTSEIAKMLDIKPNTVSTIKKVIFRKLNVTSILGLYKIALQNNFIQL